MSKFKTNQTKVFGIANIFLSLNLRLFFKYYYKQFWKLFPNQHKKNFIQKSKLTPRASVPSHDGSLLTVVHKLAESGHPRVECCHLAAEPRSWLVRWTHCYLFIRLFCAFRKISLFIQCWILTLKLTSSGNCISLCLLP